MGTPFIKDGIDSAVIAVGLKKTGSFISGSGVGVGSSVGRDVAMGEAIEGVDSAEMGVNSTGFSNPVSALQAKPADAVRSPIPATALRVYLSIPIRKNYNKFEAVFGTIVGIGILWYNP